MDSYMISYDGINSYSKSVEFIDVNSIDSAVEEREDYSDVFMNMKLYLINISTRKYQRLFGETANTLSDNANVFRVKIHTVKDNEHGYYYENYFGTGNKEEKDNEKVENSKIVIENIEKCSDKIADDVKRAATNLVISPQPNDFSLNTIQEKIRKKIVKGKEYLFTVHNIGQGLASSIGEVDMDPFLYFDFGMPYGINSCTFPLGATLPIQNDGTIIISHLHDDHWFGHQISPNAYTCSWYIPNQNRSIHFNNFATAVNIAGGNVIMYPNSFDIDSIHISNFHPMPKRVLKDFHKTGFGMRIDAHKMNDETMEEYNIYVGGDQNYYHQNPARIRELSVLVACHHGGDYGVRSGFNIISHRAKPIIVYSYGAGNSYNHPSKVTEYISAGWRREHRTPIDGDYVDEIIL